MRALHFGLVLGTCAVVATGPVLAWEFGVSDSGDVFWTVVEDFTGEASLAFFCSQAAPGMILAQAAMDQPGPSSPTAVEFGFEVAGRIFGPVSATAEGVDGALVVSSNGGADMLAAAARAVYAETDAIAFNYYESVWRFPGANQSDGFSAMLDACG